MVTEEQVEKRLEEEREKHETQRLGEGTVLFILGVICGTIVAQIWW
jgi:hypothetical protein